mmetsp:Transcript_7711/g.21954  ORF Transcript_7711/g.21954 Transcript_7711/m.21954 type:complete len:208 (-) Transcript_7711:191-814(-)
MVVATHRLPLRHLSRGEGAPGRRRRAGCDVARRDLRRGGHDLGEDCFAGERVCHVGGLRVQALVRLLRRHCGGGGVLHRACPGHGDDHKADLQLLQLALALPHRGRQRARFRGERERPAGDPEPLCEETPRERPVPPDRGARLRPRRCDDLRFAYGGRVGLHAARGEAWLGDRCAELGGVHLWLGLLRGVRLAHDELPERELASGGG